MDKGRQLLESIKEAAESLEAELYPCKGEEVEATSEAHDRDRHLDCIEKQVKNLHPLLQKIQKSLELKAEVGYLGLTHYQIQDLKELVSLANGLLTACLAHLEEKQSCGRGVLDESSSQTLRRLACSKAISKTTQR